MSDLPPASAPPTKPTRPAAAIARGPFGRLGVALALAAGLGLSACATVPPASEPEALAEFRETNDPLEPMNRTIYTFNEGVDTLLLRPAAETYRIFVPPELRSRVSNALANLREPVTLLNDLLQGRPDRAEATLSRFLINSTFGLLGLFDVATDWGFPRHSEDFGQTLATWRAEEGPYLMLPLLGPSNPRDLFGRVVDTVTDPFTWVLPDGAGTARTATGILDTREALIDPIDTVRREALDPYAQIRSLYRQRRNAEIENRTPPRGP